METAFTSMTPPVLHSPESLPLWEAGDFDYLPAANYLSDSDVLPCMKLFLYSNGDNWGFFANGKELQKKHGKGSLRPYKTFIETEDMGSIPHGWRLCADDRTAIEKIPTMRSLVKALS